MSRHQGILLCLFVCLTWKTDAVAEIKPQYGGVLEAVDVLHNGSVKTVENYEAVRLNEAATKALPDETELEHLLHWAISHSDPNALEQQAKAGQTLEHMMERRKEVEEAIEYLKNEPGEAELMKSAAGVVSNALAGEEARAKALEALSYLLEPIDNANDLDKLGGLDILLEALEPHNTEKVRAGAANALAVAASNNVEFQQRLWDKYGEGVIGKLLQIARLDNHKDAPAKGLFALSRLLDQPGFRGAFFRLDGLAVLHRLLGNSGAPFAARRKALAMLADLARWPDAGKALKDLPERGKDLIRTIEQYLEAGSLELVEKALLALRALVNAPWGKSQMQEVISPGLLERVKQHIEASAALAAEQPEYKEEVLKLADEVERAVQTLHEESDQPGHSTAPESSQQQGQSATPETAGGSRPELVRGSIQGPPKEEL